MQNWLKENWFRVSIVVLSTLTIVLSFWWFEIRPAQIKSQCAWTQRHIDAIQAQPASPDWPECLVKLGTLRSSFEDIFGVACRKETSAQPAKDYYSKSSDAEYTSCLREHGL